MRTGISRSSIRPCCGCSAPARRRQAPTLRWHRGPPRRSIRACRFPTKCASARPMRISQRISRRSSTRRRRATPQFRTRRDECRAARSGSRVAAERKLGRRAAGSLGGAGRARADDAGAGRHRRACRRRARAQRRNPARQSCRDPGGCRAVSDIDRRQTAADPTRSRRGWGSSRAPRPWRRASRRRPSDRRSTGFMLRRHVGGLAKSMSVAPRHAQPLHQSLARLVLQ